MTISSVRSLPLPEREEKDFEQVAEAVAHTREKPRIAVAKRDGQIDVSICAVQRVSIRRSTTAQSGSGFVRREWSLTGIGRSRE